MFLYGLKPHIASNFFLILGQILASDIMMYEFTLFCFWIEAALE